MTATLACLDLDDEPDLRVAAASSIDLDAAARAVSDLLVALGQDPTSADLAETPRRMASALAESLTPVAFTMTTFPNDDGYDQMVLVRDIGFSSLCAHHMLPFMGVAHVAYVPGVRVVGLSKLARLVEHVASRLQTQERLTNEVAETLQATLDPRGVGVVLEATHLCMTVRGVRAAGARTLTSALTGSLRDDPALRAEFSRLATASSHACS
jgi:GTP cyclohydrolase IA